MVLSGVVWVGPVMHASHRSADPHLRRVAEEVATPFHQLTPFHDRREHKGSTRQGYIGTSQEVGRSWPAQQLGDEQSDECSSCEEPVPGPRSDAGM